MAFTIGDIKPAVSVLVGAFLFLAFSLLVLGQISNSMTSSSVEQNATNATIAALDDFVDYLPTIVVVIIGAILLGIIALFR